MVSCVWWCTKVTPLAPAGSVLVCAAAASSPTVTSWWDVFSSVHWLLTEILGPSDVHGLCWGRGRQGLLLVVGSCSYSERRTAHVSNSYFEDRGTVSCPVWKVHPHSTQARGKNQKHLCETSHLSLAINKKRLERSILSPSSSDKCARRCQQPTHPVGL